MAALATVTDCVAQSLSLVQAATQRYVSSTLTQVLSRHNERMAWSGGALHCFKKCVGEIGYAPKSLVQMSYYHDKPLDIAKKMQFCFHEKNDEALDFGASYSWTEPNKTWLSHFFSDVA